MKQSQIFLLRHGPAVARGDKRYPNDDRPLTPQGLKKTRKAAQGMAKIMDRPDAIFASPLKRAYETALCAAQAFSPRLAVHKTDTLLPGVSSGEVISLIEGCKNYRSIMICGHEPNLSQILATLLKIQKLPCEFKKCGLALVEVDSFSTLSGQRLAWVLPPKILRSLAT